MANMRVVNKAIKVEFPKLDIEAVRGDGYVYFAGVDGFDKIPSLYANPVATSTESMIKMVLSDIRDAIIS